uniref:Mitochondrial 28S ribosomal protein S21 n=1 Tax=Caligus rogercresseyi TaxID=217165 RepID=C1BQ39_CALRO|nr:Mitochondrial 28S ribosomal protein S21 [Caligus rogercresseyi]
MHLSGPLFRHVSNQTRWISRTVMVENNEVEKAMKILNGIVANEGILARWKLTRRYEKPTQMRSRVNYERARAIYEEDMNNKIQFIMRKNRVNPYPGCG